MKMKIPNTGSGNGYYGHDIITFSDDSSDRESDSSQGTENSDFSEYLWMEFEDEFDKQVLQELEDEARMQECFEAILNDQLENETNANWVGWSDLENELHSPAEQQALRAAEVLRQFDEIKLHDDVAKKITMTLQSTLNPDAAEFVPGVKSAVASVSTPPEVAAESQ